MHHLILMWLKGASIQALNHPFPRYVLGFALITGCLFTLLPLMDFYTGCQVGLIMGSYNYLAEKRIKS